MARIGADYSGAAPVFYHYDEHTGEIHVERVQDVEPLLDRNKRMAAAGFDGFNADRSMKAIAEIPIAIVEQWAKEGVDIMNPAHNAEVLKRLRDPALAHFRLDQGRGNTPNIIVKGAR